MDDILDKHKKKKHKYESYGASKSHATHCRGTIKERVNSAMTFYNIKVYCKQNGSTTINHFQQICRHS